MEEKVSQTGTTEREVIIIMRLQHHGYRIAILVMSIILEGCASPGMYLHTYPGQRLPSSEIAVLAWTGSSFYGNYVAHIRIDQAGVFKFSTKYKEVLLPGNRRVLLDSNNLGFEWHGDRKVYIDSKDLRGLELLPGNYIVTVEPVYYNFASPGYRWVGPTPTIELGHMSRKMNFTAEPNGQYYIQWNVKQNPDAVEWPYNVKDRIIWDPQIHRRK